MTNYTIVSIEGNIGAGKTTLFNELKQKYADNSYCIFIKEPIDEWTMKIKDQNNCSILQKFYVNQEAYSFPFQITALTSRLSVLRSAIHTVSKSPDKHYVIFTERSLQTDKKVFATMLRDQGKMEDICFQIYLNLFNEFALQYTTNYTIYVKTEPKICYNRIHSRARSGEESIPIIYLEDCDKYHEYFLSDLTSEQKLTLDGDLDIYKNADVLQKWINEIETFLNLEN
jgi:deoxyadenosine/deoxycytidine kinase